MPESVSRGKERWDAAEGRGVHVQGYLVPVRPLSVSVDEAEAARGGAAVI